MARSQHAYARVNAHTHTHWSSRDSIKPSSSFQHTHTCVFHLTTLTRHFDLHPSATTNSANKLTTTVAADGGKGEQTHGTVSSEWVSRGESLEMGTGLQGLKCELKRSSGSERKRERGIARWSKKPHGADGCGYGCASLRPCYATDENGERARWFGKTVKLRGKTLSVGEKSSADREREQKASHVWCDACTIRTLRRERMCGSIDDGDNDKSQFLFILGWDDTIL